MNYDTDALKPFNPIWGETLNAKVGDFDCSLEKTLHKPPVTSFFVSNEDKSIQY